MNIDKKYIIIFCFIIGLVIIVVLAFFAFRPKNDIQTTKSNMTDMEKLLTAKAISSHDGILVLVDTPEYFLSFNIASQEFQIQLLPGEQSYAVIESIRKNAESKLLEISGLSASNICTWNVVEGVHFSYWPELSGVDYAFSTCPNGKPFKN